MKVKHDYKSTACVHERHVECRLKCKFCQAECSCECHEAAFTEAQLRHLEQWGWDTAKLRAKGSLPPVADKPKEAVGTGVNVVNPEAGSGHRQTWRSK